MLEFFEIQLIYIAAGVAFLCSVTLVVIFKYDLRFDKSIDPDYYWHHPVINKTISVIKLTVRYGALGLLLTLLVALTWNELIAPHLTRPLLQIPAMRTSLKEIARVDSFWKLLSAFVFLLALNDIRRCRLVSIWDVFLSYKSEDVEVARQVADRLIAAGKRVWFAEYFILLKNYEKFQDAINYGIDNSASAVAFTNNRYVGSPCCRLEIERLLKRMEPKRILEIMMPKENLPHKNYSQLKNSQSYICIGEDVNGILTFIKEKAGWLVEPIPSADGSGPRQTYETICLGRPVLLDITGWKLTKKGEIVYTEDVRKQFSVEGPLSTVDEVGLRRRIKELEKLLRFKPVNPLIKLELRHLKETHRRVLGELDRLESILRRIGSRTGNIYGLEFKYEHEGVGIFINLCCGPELSEVGRRKFQSQDDREMYGLLRQHSKRHVAKLDAKMRGLHLLFKENLSQMALTYWMKLYWTRKYSITIPNRTTREIGEFVFTFGFMGPFSEYCRHTHLMDRFVQSLEWK